MPANQFPFERHHFNSLAQVHGQDVSDAILAMHQDQLRSGGINPNAVDLVFPKTGGLDEEELIKSILANHTIWRRYD